ncbi:MAG: hypothetical protein QM736_03225 [Vicinamibacterales bacterium]
MRLFLSDTLTLAGRLSDQPGTDTPRERFRRFLNGWPARVDDLHALIDDAQRAPEEQSQRALMDVVVTIGRLLGFVVTYGVYERRSGAVRFDGAWRSAGLARIVLEIRTDRTRPFSPDDLARTIAALPDVQPPQEDERTIGLCIVVPPYGRRREGDGPRESEQQGPMRMLPLHAVLMLARRMEEQRLTHAQVVELLLGVDGHARAAELLAQPAPGATTPAGPHLTLVPRDEAPDYWIATVLSDGGTTPAQFVDAVIRGRQLLGVSAIGIFPASARSGDWVCFFLAGIGVVGHARLAGEVERVAAPLRHIDRYAVVFALSDVLLYDTPASLDPQSPAQRLADRIPLDAQGPFLSQVSQAEFQMLTRIQ